MNYQFVMKPLAVMIAATFALAGCQSETASSDSGAAPAKSASIQLGVKFPTPEVGASWVGAASEIEVSFFRNDLVGSLDEAEDYVDAMSDCYDSDKSNNGEGLSSIGDVELECWELPENGLRQRLAKQAVLTPDSATASIDLIPGKYRVEAEFFDESYETRETSVSYIEIGEGSHQIALRGMSATWTAETPIELQLLNQNSPLDWDPDSDGTQTPAEALGITGSLIGLHLPSLLSYPDGMPQDYNASDGLLEWFHPYVQTANVDDGESSIYVPVWRVSDGANNEKDLHPVNEWNYEWDETDNGYESSGDGKWSSYAALWQEYGEGTNTAYPELGTRGVELYQEASGLSIYNNAYVKFGVPSDFSSEDDTETERNIYYTQDDYTYWDHELQQSVTIELKIAEIGTDIETDKWGQLYFNILNGRENTVVDGSTITGYLIEVMESGTNASESALPAAFLDASLNEIAMQQGLVAGSASTCNTAENSYLDYSNQYLWDEEASQWIAGTLNQLALGQGNGNYGWMYSNQLDELENEASNTNQAIDSNNADIDSNINAGIPQEDLQGLYDEAARLEAQLALIDGNIQALGVVNASFETTSDLNGDGTVEPFEPGVYLEAPWSASCDLIVEHNYDNEDLWYSERTYTLDCQNVDASETVLAWSEEVTVEMCIQPFTLKANELAITYSSGGDVIID
ncbi:hypothetical protein H5300_09725 [Vibrio sp. SG41-7]|uniref:hypothetical protein n=1 Tax=Vibrio sp. SG41-7 TaxID=2760973 RepID=UPI0016023DC1|nr:hypothetical protein [Vibrio sp. SG41-7]MBB1463592.1 hypothetical protein [Vibrio sp. SG41-7]